MDDEGQFHFSTDFRFPDSKDNPLTDLKAYESECDDLTKRLIRSIVAEMWGKRNQHPFKAIRHLAMAEIISCAEPYDNAEHFWSAMMFDYIPLYEKMASKLKKPYGYDSSKIIRPITMSSFGMMPMLPMDFGKMKS